MPVSNYYGFVGFLSPVYQFTLYDQNGNALNLTGVDAATMTFELFDVETSQTIVGSGPVTIVNASEGIVSYQWTFQDGEAMQPTTYRAYATAQLPGDAGPRAFYIGNATLVDYPGGVPVTVQDVNLDQINSQNVPTTVNGINVPAGTLPVVVVLPASVQDIEASGYVAASGTPPATTNAGSDTIYTFSSQVNRVIIQNNTSANLNFDFDQAASAGSYLLVPGAIIIYPKKCTALHLYTAAAQNINGSTAGNIVVRGAL